MFWKKGKCVVIIVNIFGIIIYYIKIIVFPTPSIILDIFYKVLNCNFPIVDNFNVKKRLKFKHYLYICMFDIKIL